jgi:hypothetical protein
MVRLDEVGSGLGKSWQYSENMFVFRGAPKKTQAGADKLDADGTPLCYSRAYSEIHSS